MRVVLLKPGDEPILIAAAGALNSAMVTPKKASLLLADPNYLMIVAFDDNGAIMGRIYGNVLARHDATDLLLYEVDVVAAHQRKGVGHAMLSFVSNLSAERGYGEMWVLTEPDNEAGNALYASTGGRLEGSPTNMYVFTPEKA